MKKPIIGIPMDWNEPGGYSQSHWYAIRKNYCTCVSDHGAAALLLALDMDSIDTYISLIDGLLITGGGFDIPPNLYGEDTIHPTVKTKEERTMFEYEIAKAALDEDLPVLGICGGQQLITVILGGTLHQHIPDAFENPLTHKQQPPFDQPAHPVSIIEGTLLDSITGVETMNVNSDHHQATKDITDKMVVNAIAPDGVIESVSSTEHSFCLGTVWHPEYAADPCDSKIVGAFVDAARARMK